MASNKNRFTELYSIDCSDKIESKQNLSYLSWVYAWAELKKRYPESYYTIYERQDGIPYWTDGKTAWVKTGVTLVDGEYVQEHVEYLPIMDYKNKSIPVENVTSMDMNKAIQRSLTKAVARHGLGLYIYAGEDLPEVSEDDKAEIADLISKIDAQLKQIGATMTAEQKKEYPAKVIKPIIGQLNYRNCTDKNLLQRLLTKMTTA